MPFASLPRRAAVAAGLLLSLLAGSVISAPRVAADPGFEVSYETIPGSGGIELSAIVAQPGGAGPHPIIVMPSSWALNFIEYTVPAIEWAAHGFVVVSYTSRGFWESEGEIDIAGAPTVADVSAVIDWAVTHASGDPNRVGALGISYGAGISLLAAADDSRIDSVVAMSGWADLTASLYPNETVSEASINLLLGVGELTGTPGPEMEAVRAAYEQGDLEPALALAPSRSPASRIDDLNATGTAVLLANAWNDSFFPPSQVVDFFTRLSGPKRLLLAPGDHATAELPGLLGLPTNQWAEALDWMEATVGDSSAAPGPAITLVGNDTDRDIITGTSWDGLATDRTYHLTRPRWSLLEPTTGDLASAPSPSWRHEITGGRDTIAGSGPILVSGALQAYLGLAPAIPIGLVDRHHGAVWQSDRFGGGEQLVGTPELNLTVDSTTADTTIVAYLYERPLVGPATLISHQPYTIRQASPGEPVTINLDLEPTAWELEWGSRIVLVLDTADDRYTSVTEARSEIGFSSAVTSATLTLPVR